MYFWISAFDHRAIVVPKMHIVHWAHNEWWHNDGYEEEKEGEVSGAGPASKMTQSEGDQKGHKYICFARSALCTGNH